MSNRDYSDEDPLHCDDRYLAIDPDEALENLRACGLELILTIKQQVESSNYALDPLVQKIELLNQATYDYFFVIEPVRENAHDSAHPFRDVISYWILNKEAKSVELRALLELDDISDYVDPSGLDKYSWIIDPDDLESLFTRDDNESEQDAESCRSSELIE